MVYCEVCNINTANMKSHCKSKKHINGGKRDAMSVEQLKEYHKKYYIEHNLKDKYKEKKKCECCNKMVAKYNWSKHIQTEKHFKKQHQANNPEPPYVRDRLMKEDEIIDPLTIKEEDINFYEDKCESCDCELESDEEEMKYCKDCNKLPTILSSSDSTDSTDTEEVIKNIIISLNSDSEDEIGEVMKEVTEIEALPIKKINKKSTKK
jgi:hypothetical protein